MWGGLRREGRERRGNRNIENFMINYCQTNDSCFSTTPNTQLFTSGKNMQTSQDLASDFSLTPQNPVVSCFKCCLGPRHARRPSCAILTVPCAVPPPALEFPVKGTPVIITVDGDAGVVNHVTINKRKDTGLVRKLCKRGNRLTVGKLPEGIDFLTNAHCPLSPMLTRPTSPPARSHYLPFLCL